MGAEAETLSAHERRRTNPQRTAAAALLAAFLMSPTAVLAQGLPEGPGRTEFTNTCATCHSLEQVTSQRLSRDAWAQKVESMRSLGAESAQADFDRIVEYLAKNFSDEKASPPAPASPVTEAPTPSSANPAKPAPH